jgi:hypothetical protein
MAPRSDRRKTAAADRLHPELWDDVKSRWHRGSKAGLAGKWNARKAQLAVLEYKRESAKRFGDTGYRTKKPGAGNTLAKWTKEDWGYVEGKPSAKSKPAAKGKPSAKSKPAAKGKPAANGNPAAKSKPATKGKPAAKSKPAANGNPAAKSKPATKGKPAAKSKAAAKGKPASDGRYLPRAVREQLSASEKRAEALAKSGKKGQVVPYTDSVRRKMQRLRAAHN